MKVYCMTMNREKYVYVTLTFVNKTDNVRLTQY